MTCVSGGEGGEWTLIDDIVSQQLGSFALTLHYVFTYNHTLLQINTPIILTRQLQNLFLVMVSEIYDREAKIVVCQPR